MPKIFALLLVLAQTDLRSVLPDATKISIINGGKPAAILRTGFDAGPAPGDILNGHFFPAVIAYNTGQYTTAVAESTFLIERANYLSANTRQAEFMSIAHYLRGMIYLYHANGVGRHDSARADFQAAIRWNPTNYMAHLELSRVYSDLGFTKEATSVLNRLLALKPAKDVVEDAEQEIKKLPKAALKNDH